jgi:hypothetical protein
MVMVTRPWPDRYTTASRPLPTGCEPPQTTRYTLNYKFYNNISFHWHTFIKPYFWLNSKTLTLPMPGSEQRRKHKKRKKQKRKRATRPSNLGHQAYPRKYGINFHILTMTRRWVDGYQTVTRWLPDSYPTVVNHLT